MASADTDKMLREMASVRGFRLVKSRRRKPGGDYGRYGLADAKSGKACFGIGEQGLKASAKEIADFLRGRVQSDWKSSLSAADAEPEPSRRRAARPSRTPEPEPPRRRAARPSRAPEPPRNRVAKPSRLPEPAPPPRKQKVKRQKESSPAQRQLPLLATVKPSAPAKPRPEPRPKPKPELVIREATSRDAAGIAALIEDDDAPSTRRIAATIAALAEQGTPVLVAHQGEIVGAVSYDVLLSVHRGAPQGRIAFIATAKNVRRKGIGSNLLEQAEARLRKLGCGTFELVNPIELSNANHFLRGHEYERSGYRFERDA